MSAPNDAAELVRAWLREHPSRLTQDQMQELILELKNRLGRALKAAEVNAVVEAFENVEAQPT